MGDGSTRAGPTPLGAAIWATLHVGALVVLFALAAERVGAVAQTAPTSPETAIETFGAHCFSPFLTAERAEARIGLPGLRVDFYDLDPFSAQNAPSPAQGRPATTGTDRRCEVAFNGRHTDAAALGVAEALAEEGILEAADVPSDFPVMSGTEFMAARQLNPNRIAVVQIGTREGPNGVETFMNVERLLPSTSGM